MKTTKQVLLMLMSMVVGIGLSYALNVSQTLTNTVAYIQKMIFTTNGNDTGQAKVVIDGASGSIKMSGALNIQPGALSNSSIVSGDLATGAVTNEKIALDAVTMDKIANDAVTSGMIIDGNVTTNDLATGAVNMTKLSSELVDALTGTFTQVADNTKNVTSLSGWRHNLYKNNAAILQVYANTSGGNKNIGDHTYCFSIDGGTIRLVDKSESGNSDINYDNSIPGWILKNNKMALCGDILNY